MWFGKFLASEDLWKLLELPGFAPDVLEQLQQAGIASLAALDCVDDGTLVDIHGIVP